MDVPSIYYVLTLCIFGFVLVISKKWKISMLVAWMFFIVVETILIRKPTAAARYKLELFWSWSVPSLHEQILFNVLVFIPIGFLLGSITGSFDRKILQVITCTAVGTVFSTFIEVTQLLTHRGLFEFDDIVHNSFGAFLGVIASLLLERVLKSMNACQSRKIQR